MTYVVYTKSPGVTPDLYDQTVLELGVAPISGQQAHYWNFVDGALCTIDIWDSQADADRFAAERLFPAFERVGHRPSPESVIVGFVPAAAT